MDHKGLSFLTLPSLLLPWQDGDSTGPIALPPRCCCLRSPHWLHLLIFQVFTHILPSTWWPVLFATTAESNCLSSTLETQFVLPPLDFSSTVDYSYMFHIVKSLFQWLLCDSDQPSVLWYLISACILLPSRLTSSEITCLLWVKFLHWACVYWAFALCQHGFKALNWDVALDAHLFGPCRVGEVAERSRDHKRRASWKCDGGKTKSMGKLWGRDLTKTWILESSLSYTCSLFDS